MIAAGAIHITMDVTTNVVITRDIACPDVNAEINRYRSSAGTGTPQKKEIELILAQSTHSKKIRRKVYGWIRLYIST